MKNIFKSAIIITTLFMFGCSSMNTALKKRELDVESRLSYAVVLDPLAPEERIVYTRVRDVSGNKMRKVMQTTIEQQLSAEGFTVTNNPKEANLMLNATILSAGKTTADEADRSLSAGYKGAAEGAALGYMVGAAGGSSSSDSMKSGLVAGAAGFLADALVEDVYYTFVMDIELRERPLEGDEIENSTQNKSATGMSTSNTATLSMAESSVKRGENFKWIIHKTRIVTTANKMNLKIEEAIPAVQDKTASSLSEMLM